MQVPRSLRIVGLCVGAILLGWRYLMELLSTVSNIQFALQNAPSVIRWITSNQGDGILGLIGVSMIVVVFFVRDKSGAPVAPPVISRRAVADDTPVRLPVKNTYAASDTSMVVTNIPSHRDKQVVNVSPSYLIKFFEDHVHVQAEKILEAYIGQWMTIPDAEVTDIMNLSSGKVCVYTKAGVLLTFNVDWKPRVSVLPRGSRINAIGQIKGMIASQVDLYNCELI